MHLTNKPFKVVFFAITFFWVMVIIGFSIILLPPVEKLLDFFSTIKAGKWGTILSIVVTLLGYLTIQFLVKKVVHKLKGTFTNGYFKPLYLNVLILIYIGLLIYLTIMYFNFYMNFIPF